jgi:subtilisin family serine protease
VKRSRKSIIAYLSSLILLPFVLASANQETALFKIQDSMPKLVSTTNAGDKISGHKNVIENLIDRAAVLQSDFVSVLDNLKSENLIIDYKAYWIANVIAVTADSAIIWQLAQRDDIMQIGEDYPVELITPVESDIPAIASNGPEAGLNAVSAPQAWSLGLDGAGTLVCNFDTGVNGNHTALMAKYRGNNGGSAAACWFDPFTNTSYPSDLQGHGTHTMGTMVGSSDTDTIGVAPGAEWIAAAVLERGGGTQRTITDILSAFQWAADPDGDPSTTDDVPDVINNSWGIPIGYYPACDQTFWEAIDNLEAAGVVCIFAAGNEGSNAQTIRTPADRITSDFNAFSVGAVDGNDSQHLVASFSSRGPSGCDGLTIKPEVTAPGVGIRSAARNGGYVMMSGTSMAAPHVSGAVAILRQFNPHATPVEIKQALMNSAHDLGLTGEDNDYGWGMIDIRQAIDLMPTPEHPLMAFSGIEIAGDGVVAPGEVTYISVAVENLGSGIGNLQASIYTGNLGISVVGENYSVLSIAHSQISSFGPFTLAISEQAELGVSIPMMMLLSGPDFIDTLNFDIIIGGEAIPTMATLGNSAVELSFSNFGNLGLGSRSLRPMGGIGYRLAQIGEDILTNSSLILATDSNHVSDAACSILPGVSDNDFAPVRGGQSRVYDDGAVMTGLAIYNDSLAENPIGLEITQKVFCWKSSELPIIVVEYCVKNNSGNSIENLGVGLLCDWDLGQNNSDNLAGFYGQAGYISDASGSEFAGIAALNYQAGAYSVINNENLNNGYSDNSKYTALNSGIGNSISETSGNYSHIISVNQINIAAGDSVVVAFAMVAAGSLEEMSANIGLAGNLYNQTTSTENNISLPEAHTIISNYPNPFNSNTIITVDDNRNIGDMISIYDVMGRLIREIPITGGNMVWDGTESNGNTVAAGIYFARLNSQGQTRKMLLVK